MRSTVSLSLLLTATLGLCANGTAGEMPEGPVTRMGLYQRHPATGEAGMLVSTCPLNAYGVPSACLLGTPVCGNREYLWVPRSSPLYQEVYALANESMIHGRIASLKGADAASTCGAPGCHDGIEILTVAGIR